MEPGGLAPPPLLVQRLGTRVPEVGVGTGVFVVSLHVLWLSVVGPFALQQGRLF